MERGIFTFQHFLLAVPHDVDVLNADELEFNVGVIVFVFVALSCSPVCKCVQLEKTSGTHFSGEAEQFKGQACYTTLLLVHKHIAGVFLRRSLCADPADREQFENIKPT